MRLHMKQFLFIPYHHDHPWTLMDQTRENFSELQKGADSDLFYFTDFYIS